MYQREGPGGLIFKLRLGLTTAPDAAHAPSSFAPCPPTYTPPSRPTPPRMTITQRAKTVHREEDKLSMSSSSL